MPVSRRIHLRLALAGGLGLAYGVSLQAADSDGGAPTAADLEFFEKQVRPLLANHCHKCHGPDEQKGGLRLDSRSAVLAGGDTGEAVVSGKPDESLLIEAVGYGGLYQMPPTGKLAESEIATLRQWVELGAPWPEAAVATEGGKPAASFDLHERAQRWAFQPLVEHTPPTVRDTGWPRTAADRFILAKLEAAELTPAEPADRRTLLRRVTYDLTGLPPSPAEIESFLADETPTAFDRVVDRLLASPRYGQRWARHWLDLVRYAESRGHEFDYPVPNAFQYRDYVIRALNADVPYDQFVVEHVAGDLLPVPRLNPEHGFNESILGTGFWFLGEEVHSPVDIRGDETDRNDNKIDVLSKTFLGLTVACARCHDHKFDAISTRDYYALAGFVLSSGYRQVPFEALEQNRHIACELASLSARQRPKLAAAIAAAAKPALQRMADVLMAAREVLAAGADAALRAERLAVGAERIAVDPRVLNSWVGEIDRATYDSSSPLHAWALLASGPADAPPADVFRPLAQRWREQADAAAGALAGARVVIDYSQINKADWLQDGFAFGPGPVLPGETRLVTGPKGAIDGGPIVKVFDRAAAVSDPVWDVQQLAPGVEREGGRLAWSQSGRTLRTPSFTLGEGKLHYLVSGSGRAYAAVDSHRMNNGPLHGALVREWKAPNGAFQWIEHDLTAYPGHRAHIEFTPYLAGEVGPNESSILAIAMVVESSRPPAAVATQGCGVRANTERNGESTELSRVPLHGATAESVAQAYQRTFIDALTRFGADSLIGSEGAADAARLVDWLVHRPELFSAPDDAPLQRVHEIARPFLEEHARLVAKVPSESQTAPAMWEGSGVDELVLLRGNPKTPGEAVPRRHLEAIAGAEQPAVEQGSGRLELARRIVDPRHPLVARVIVNRVWQHLFGRGIVATVDNLGILGDPPTHPELLDFLAERFVENGWSIKRLVRELVVSRAYQLSSRPSGLALETDPRNLLLSHMNMRRLEAEAIRDAVLAVSGRLDERMYGPSVATHLTPFMEGRGRPESGPLDGAGRRSIYLSVRRNFLSSTFLAFDFPIPFTTTGRRTVSNVPAQALTMMNSPFVVAEARNWAQRTLGAGRSAGERIDDLYVAAFARPATDAERQSALAFVAEQSRRYGSGPEDPRAWADLCHVLLNVKEFIYIQ
ncbi:MAG TPA: PSD1 and planctomycete cytochrome C domain-containing protein [Pirellulales bacterium]|nr:PSD1 and planctomycete cytochrome C domain-containing protein [Pirellulales bacterium]